MLETGRESIASDWLERQQQLNQFDSWDMRARAAVRRQTEAYNIALHWKQQRTHISLLLEAPFGQGVFLISGDEGQDFRLRLPNGGEIVNTTPETLLEEVVGWSLPVSGLKFWIRGMPRPEADYRFQADDMGRTRSLQQDQWSVRIVDYFENGPEPLLPRRLELFREEIRIKLVIERWQAEDSAPEGPGLFPEFD